MDVIQRVFGEGKDLDALQMAARAVVLFVMMLVLIRIGGMRSFGRKSSFDTIIVVMFGAVLSRAMTGSSPFWPTVAGATVLVVIHRIVATATSRWRWLERAIKGDHSCMYRDGKLFERHMRFHGISVADLDEATRRQLQAPDHRAAREIYLESSGELSAIENRAQPRLRTRTEPALRH
jgi:uncharacterized membrane protein YcaP (DUF421 family)